MARILVTDPDVLALTDRVWQAGEAFARAGVLAEEAAIEIGRKARAVNRPVERLGRAAMAGQVERNRAAGLGEGRLVEHPGIEVGAKAVHEQDRDRVAGAPCASCCQKTGFCFRRRRRRSDGFARR